LNGTVYGAGIGGRKNLMIAKHFTIEELVPPESLEGQSDPWDLFEPDAIYMIDGIREFFGVPVTINTWHNGGKFSYRGFRPAVCAVGALKSAHRAGMAFDMDVKGYTAEEARQKILENQDNPLLSHIMRMEAAVNWIHADVLMSGKPRIYMFHA
jgi:hypothetical protein